MISEQNYGNMIEALGVYASAVSNTATSMLDLANVCCGILGEEDPGVGKIKSDISRISKGYLQSAKQATNLSKLLQEELAKQQSEKDIWESND